VVVADTDALPDSSRSLAFSFDINSLVAGTGGIPAAPVARLPRVFNCDIAILQYQACAGWAGDAPRSTTRSMPVMSAFDGCKLAVEARLGHEESPRDPVIDRSAGPGRWFSLPLYNGRDANHVPAEPLYGRKLTTPLLLSVTLAPTTHPDIVESINVVFDPGA
jgi:hypothetical protein